MPARTEANPAVDAVNSDDELDNWFDDNPFGSPEPETAAAAGSAATNAKKRKADEPASRDLGIDTELDVNKKVRVPRVKLDETKCAPPFYLFACCPVWSHLNSNEPNHVDSSPRMGSRNSARRHKT
jgi:hypothetical protein